MYVGSWQTLARGTVAISLPSTPEFNLDQSDTDGHWGPPGRSRHLLSSWNGEAKATTATDSNTKAER